MGFGWPGFGLEHEFEDLCTYQGSIWDETCSSNIDQCMRIVHYGGCSPWKKRSVSKGGGGAPGVLGNASWRGEKLHTACMGEAWKKRGLI